MTFDFTLKDTSFFKSSITSDYQAGEIKMSVIKDGYCMRINEDFDKQKPIFVNFFSMPRFPFETSTF